MPTHTYTHTCLLSLSFRSKLSKEEAEARQLTDDTLSKIRAVKVRIREAELAEQVGQGGLGQGGGGGWMDLLLQRSAELQRPSGPCGLLRPQEPMPTGQPHPIPRRGERRVVPWC